MNCHNFQYTLHKMQHALRHQYIRVSQVGQGWMHACTQGVISIPEQGLLEMSSQCPCCDHPCVKRGLGVEYKFTLLDWGRFTLREHCCRWRAPTVAELSQLPWQPATEIFPVHIVLGNGQPAPSMGNATKPRGNASATAVGRYEDRCAW